MLVICLRHWKIVSRKKFMGKRFLVECSSWEREGGRICQRGELTCIVSAPEIKAFQCI